MVFRIYEARKSIIGSIWAWFRAGIPVEAGIFLFVKKSLKYVVKGHMYHTKMTDGSRGL
jgi:hypothetical protein